MAYIQIYRPFASLKKLSAFRGFYFVLSRDFGFARFRDFHFDFRDFRFDGFRYVDFRDFDFRYDFARYALDYVQP